MVEITETPPQDILDELALLRIQLEQEVPPKVLDKNLLIATWNIRAFGDLTKKWDSEDDDSPKRDFRALLEITEIVSRFHVMAIQEVRENIRSLRYMLKLLGLHWGVILTDVTKGSQGNFERLAFLFDTRVVQLSGLRAPAELDNAPRTIFDKGSDTGHFYDQIAWFTGEKNSPILSMKFLNAGYFDFLQATLKGLNLTKNALSWRISDHYPCGGRSFR